MRVTLVFNELTVDQLRAVAASCSGNREAFGVGGAWRPRVNCDGSELFSVKVDPVTPGVAQQIIAAATHAK